MQPGKENMLILLNSLEENNSSLPTSLKGTTSKRTYWWGGWGETMIFKNVLVVSGEEPFLLWNLPSTSVCTCSQLGWKVHLEKVRAYWTSSLTHTHTHSLRTKWIFKGTIFILQPFALKGSRTLSPTPNTSGSVVLLFWLRGVIAGHITRESFLRESCQFPPLPPTWVVGWIRVDLSERGHRTFQAFQVHSKLNRTKRKQSRSCKCEHKGSICKNPISPWAWLAILLIQVLATHHSSLHIPLLSKFSSTISFQHHPVPPPASDNLSTNKGQPPNSLALSPYPGPFRPVWLYNLLWNFFPQSSTFVEIPP